MKAYDLTIVDRTREQLLKLGARRGPIIVGPWLSEIGFEVLYWIPFLRWAFAFAGIPREDVWIVSRGGCRSWYADLSQNYLDVLDLYTPEAFRAGNARRMAEQAEHAVRLNLRHGRQSTKQHMVTAFDREILARLPVQGRLLHPSMLYALFRPFWLRRLPDLYTEMTIPQRWHAPPVLEGLPASYVAAKFYSSECCPSSVVHRRMVQDIVRTVTETTDVVLLHGPAKYDEHGEFPLEPHPRVHRLPMTPATNLETQTAAIAGARMFVGTYGGFAYLAPFLGVRARTFYARPNFRRDHRNVLDRVCQTVLHSPFTVELIGGGAGHLDRQTRRMVRRAA